MKDIETIRVPLGELADFRPTHLAEVRWFTVDKYCYSISERRAIFFKRRVLWRDHPWGQDGGRAGGDFFNQWTLETRSDEGAWRADGRSSEEAGWKALAPMTERHETALSAAIALREYVGGQLDSLEEKERELRATYLRIADAIEWEICLGFHKGVQYCDDTSDPELIQENDRRTE